MAFLFFLPRFIPPLIISLIPLSFFLPKFLPPLGFVPPSKVFPQLQQQQLQLPITGLVNLLPLLILPLLTIPLSIPLIKQEE